jgi:phenylalanyl-tRNA synthetase alpha chain
VIFLLGGYMKEKILALRNEFFTKIESIQDLKDLNDLRVFYLGKKGSVQDLLKVMQDLSIEEKKEIGALLNTLKTDFENEIELVKVKLEELAFNNQIDKDEIDITLPATKIKTGVKHPINRVIEEVEELFVSMGYDVVEGPEIEFDLFNFEKLNLPKDHPARDSQDSFYITNEVLLRTQTSPVQARTMEKSSGPIRIICPGKVYRRDNDDATHSHQFHQIEGLVIGENISLADLKGTLELFAKKMFGETRTVRFRPSFFPFTEPSIEVDVSCFKCGGLGCSLCKNTGWIEILGAGMVHPNVLEMSGYDSTKYTGFAFGMGPERIAMLKYGVNDVRHFYTNDLRFLDNFNRTSGGDE